MASGLYIDQKRDFHVVRWLIILGVVLLLAATGYYAYEWYTTGARPPLVPLPAVAYADPSVNETPITKKQINDYKVPATHPRYISIPALGITKARVVIVGLLKNNELDTPLHIDDTAWYDKSAFPGQGYGVVLIDGHNGGISRDGIFVHLDKLKNGDTITIERGDGKKFTYDVVENRTVSLKEANTTGMNRLLEPYNSNKEGLGLITCAGTWIPRDHVFNERIMVRAVAE
ncbi:MAG: class F sortase [Candidatus Nomurabacteria bacterium]|nr:MAG: class F sortase [Candidatus Nomurabacteria bacterium]